MNSNDIWPILWIVFMLGLIISMIVAAIRERGPRPARKPKVKKGKKGAQPATETGSAIPAGDGFGDDGFGENGFPNADPMDFKENVPSR